MEQTEKRELSVYVGAQCTINPARAVICDVRYRTDNRARKVYNLQL
jgi:tetrahydromethanopterin S-methyltransferase subunit F